MTKTLSKVVIEGTYFNILMAYDKPTANIILKGKTKNISLKIRKKTRMSIFTCLIQHSTGSHSHSNQMQRRKKGIKIRKEEIELSLFADDMILYIENPKRFHQETTGTDKQIQQSSRIQNKYQEIDCIFIHQ